MLSPYFTLVRTFPAIQQGMMTFRKRSDFWDIEAIDESGNGLISEERLSNILSNPNLGLRVDDSQ